MKKIACPDCGYMNKKRDLYCLECGCMLPMEDETQSDQGGKRRGIVIAIVLLAVIIVGGFAAWRYLFSPWARLNRAINKTETEFVNQISKQEGLQAFLENVGDLYEKGNFSANVIYAADNDTIELNTDYSRSRNAMAGSLGIISSEAGEPIRIKYSANRNSMRFTVPGVLNEVYGFRFSELRSRYNRSKIRSLLNLPELSNKLATPYRKYSVKNWLKRTERKTWKKIMRSLSYERCGSCEIKIGNNTEKCDVFRVSWDEKAVQELIDKGMPSKTSQHLKQLVSAFSDLSPDLQCYVNRDGYLVGLDYVLAGDKYSVFLDGKQNLWENVSASVVSITGQSFSGSGKVQSDEDALIFAIDFGNEKSFCFEYSDIDGDFVLSSSEEMWANGTVLASDEGIELSLNDCDAIEKAVSLTVSLDPLHEKPRQLSRDYIDLFNLKASDLERIALELVEYLPLLKD